MPKTETLDFKDNTLLPLLYGAHNEHLSHIETHMNVTLSDRGTTLTISGNSRAVQKALNVLKYLHSRVKKDKPINIAEIDSAIRFAEDKYMTKKKKKAAQSDLIIRTRNKDIAPRSPNQTLYIEALLQKDMVFGLGPAGTGKTYLAVAAGVSLYIQGIVKRLVFCRPAVEAGENLGFLPCDMKEKIDPYLRPIYDALHDMLPQDFLEKKMIEGEIEIAPLAFMRGRTLSNAFVICDEAQNTTSLQMKMFLTRMGENTRMIITGDASQTDLPPGVTSGLHEARNILKNIDDITFVELTAKDVIRHPLVSKIVRAYGRHSD